ncbi:MAG: DUF5719 family protein [Bifidobacterium pullorum]
MWRITHRSPCQRLTAQGTTAADEGQLDAGRVTMFDLGEAPEHTLGVVIESDAAVNATGLCRTRR